MPAVSQHCSNIIQESSLAALVRIFEPDTAFCSECFDMIDFLIERVIFQGLIINSRLSVPVVKGLFLQLTQIPLVSFGEDAQTTPFCRDRHYARKVECHFGIRTESVLGGSPFRDSFLARSL